jgi:predicted 3-demethylubiquinone-9 3-methyltransferase (glyoxalase superfamily)
VTRLPTFVVFDGKQRRRSVCGRPRSTTGATLRPSRYRECGPGTPGIVERAGVLGSRQDHVTMDRRCGASSRFRPAISLCFDCDTEAAGDAVLDALGDGRRAADGGARVPLQPWLAWVKDRFGVAWQPHNA